MQGKGKRGRRREKGKEKGRGEGEGRRGRSMIDDVWCGPDFVMIFLCFVPTDPRRE